MSSDRGRDDVPRIRHEPPATAKTPGSADAGDPYAQWLDRMQRARVRHAAITKNLYTWSNYKTWADKMKGSFDDEPTEAERPGRPNVNPNVPRLPKK